MSESINLARFKKGSEKFEVVVHPERAAEFRQSQGDVRDVVVHPGVFSDAKKGLKASEKRLQAVFGTDDTLEVAKQVILRGEIQVTSEYRQRIRDEKKAAIVGLILRQGIDPRTGAPHTRDRIEASLNEAKVRIDDNQPAEAQVQEILKKLRPIIPIKLVVKTINIVIPPKYVAKSFPVIKQYGKILKEEWRSDGGWQGKIEIPGGMELDFYDKLNNLTQGQLQATVIEGEKNE